MTQDWHDLLLFIILFTVRPPVNYLFTVGHPPEVIIIVPIVLPGTVILPVMCRKLYDIRMTGSLYTHDLLMSTKSSSEISKYKLWRPVCSHTLTACGNVTTEHVHAPSSQFRVHKDGQKFIPTLKPPTGANSSTVWSVYSDRRTDSRTEGKGPVVHHHLSSTPSPTHRSCQRFRVCVWFWYLLVNEVGRAGRVKSYLVLLLGGIFEEYILVEFKFERPSKEHPNMFALLLFLLFWVAVAGNFS